jgi:hypothetical protein
MFSENAVITYKTDVPPYYILCNLIKFVFVLNELSIAIVLPNNISWKMHTSFCLLCIMHIIDVLWNLFLLDLCRSVVSAFRHMMTVQSCVNSLVGTIFTAPASISGCTSMQHAPCASTTFGKAAVAVEVKKYECPPLDNANPFRLHACAAANVTPGRVLCKFLYPNVLIESIMY